ncbi:MAG: CO dehydrogenase/acetyl-CoA synthase subunit delta [Phycisphaerae bacterium]|jgi:acetyl-CoA decarbonylase/synthase complex subunit delta|nr:CO dehydrogenase/acetyl-CoA synthase subunit delta [Phycisphaerae bacterium]
MALPELAEAYSGTVNEITLGATKDDGGTRTSTITIGGAQTIAYGGARDTTGNKPVIAIDVLDAPPTDWAPALLEPYKDVVNDPAAWAKKAVEQFGADLICLKFDSIHPDKGDADPASAVEATKKVLGAVGVPVILWGSGNDEKDNQAMPKISEAAKGENCLLGTVSQDNYRTLTAVAMADGHLLIAQAPLDINIAKQVNILLSDMNFPLERVVMFQTTGALGYGLEYAYSIQERERQAALAGDKMMAMPLVCDVGYESWRAKEAKTTEQSEWGPAEKRGPMWEAITGICLLQSGVDIIRMRHPEAIRTVKGFIEGLWK